MVPDFQIDLQARQRMSLKQFFKSYDSESAQSGLEFAYCPQCRSELIKKEIDNIQRMYCTNCRYIQYINPLPGVCVLVDKDRKVLIGKRSNQAAESNKWCLPCGFIEHHETFLDAAHREVFEETGLEIRIKSLINISSNHISPHLHTLVPVLTASVVGGQLNPGDDIKALTWLSKNDPFPEMAFEADKFVIEKYFKYELNGLPIDRRFSLSAIARSIK